MSDAQARMQILEMIENGQISAEEGLRLLEAMNGADDLKGLGAGEEDVSSAGPGASPAFARIPINGGAGSTPETHTGEAPVEPEVVEAPRERGIPPEARKFKRWWIIPMGAGVVITVCGGLLMYWLLQRAGVSLWFFLASIPFLFGLAVIILSWQARTAPWLHLRIYDNDTAGRTHLAFSFPLPTRPAVWFFQRFGNRISGLDSVPVEQVIQALETTATQENPFYIHVEDDDGDKIELFIG
jgi:hypothetical protein